MAYTREQLRADLLANADQVRNSWILWRSMSPKQQNQSIAFRQVWSDVNDVHVNGTLDKALALLATMEGYRSARPESPSPTCSGIFEQFSTLFSMITSWFASFFKGKFPI
jgi:hypothetical protein